ncbi:tRNA pseudouridine(13) synthase TruD [Deinococcota bacterium DY0809b]
MEPERLVFDFDRYPYLTAALPGTGGRIRTEIEDFTVTEVPAYAPSGEGEHLYVFLEKRGLTTRQVFDHLHRELRIPEKAIGVAGLKDKHAVTRQWISLPARYADRLPQLEELPGVRILETGLHTNKLGVGHLRGNRFEIVIRDVVPEALSLAKAVLLELERTGVPNYYGPQRFGLGGRNPLRGYELVTRGKGRGRPWLKKFLIGSLQSLLFNDWLALRLERGLYDRVVQGDVAKKHATRGEFLVEDPEAENPRAAVLEISATGPLHGRKYFEAQGKARAIEDELLVAYGLDREQFHARKGARRPLRFPLEEAAVEASDYGLRLRFFLPKGAYATALLREVMKKNPEADGPGGADEGEL